MSWWLSPFFFFPVLRFPFLATILNTKLDPVFSLMIRITWKKEKWRKERKWTGLGYSFSCLRVLRITMVVGIEGTYKKGPQFFSFSVFGFAQTMFHLLKNGQVSFFWGHWKRLVLNKFLAVRLLDEADSQIKRFRFI